MQDKKQQDTEVMAKKAAAQKAKEAMQAKKKLQDDSKKLKQPKRNQNNLILALEELEITAAGGVEVGVVKTAAERPQCQKKLPVIYHNCKM